MISPTLQIIIINYNSTDSLISCLDSIRANAPASATKLWVWDNNSKDNPGQIRHFYPEVDLIENDGNIGFGAAINKGLAQSNTAYVMLLNPDTVLCEGFIDKALEYLSSHPDIGILGPKITNSDGSLQDSARAFPNVLTGLFGRTSFLSRIFPYNRFSKINLITRQYSAKTVLEPDWVSGACMVVRREAILQTGLMDQRFFMYWEDADWCRRMKKNGWRVVYYPEITVIHSAGHSSDSRPIHSSLEFHKSAYRLFGKYAKGYKKIFSPLVFGLLAMRFYLHAGIRFLKMWCCGPR